MTQQTKYFNKLTKTITHVFSLYQPWACCCYGHLLLYRETKDDFYLMKSVDQVEFSAVTLTAPTETRILLVEEASEGVRPVATLDNCAIFSS